MKTLSLTCILALSLISALRADPSQNEDAMDQQIQSKLTDFANNGGSMADWDTIEGWLENYQQTYGTTEHTTHNLIVMRELQLKTGKRQIGDIGSQMYTEAILGTAKDPNPTISAMTANLASLNSTPIQLQFTAANGSPVDLSQLRGKVVLLDFWATWCGPCVSEVPNVVATYQKYHDQGFEIVGISLDQDINAMNSFTQSNGMTWPQYFDGKVWQNDIFTKYFGVPLRGQMTTTSGIPIMLLIGKNGLIASYNARNDLDGAVSKALAAAP